MKINFEIDTEVSKDIEAAIFLLQSISCIEPEKKTTPKKVEKKTEAKSAPEVKQEGMSEEEAENLKSEIRVLLQQKVKGKELQEKAKAKLSELGSPNVTQLKNEKLNEFKSFLESL